MSRNPSDDESAHDSAEEGSEVHDGSSESGGESESEASETQGFLDDMAEEGDETEQSDDEDEDDDEDLTPSYPFPQFSRLPIELRHKIWELFCPELTSRALTLDFNLTQFQGTTSRFWHLSDGAALYYQTEAIRTVLAVHQESRALALKRFPDPIPIMAEDADAIIRFHPEKDVPILNGLNHLEEIESADQCRLPDCFETLKHFAIGGWEFRDRFYPGVIPILIHKFRSLQTVFLCTTSISVQRKKILWCTSELVHRHDVETFERSPGYGEDGQFLYCWPDLENHADFAKFQIPQGFADSVLAADARILQEKGIGIWPMIAFEFRKGMRRYASLHYYQSDGFDDAQSESSEDSGAEEESESGTDLDQYESDGIDDEEIEHVSADEDDEISIDGDAEDGESGARFSSPEPEPETINRARKRRVIEDSDDEEEEDDGVSVGGEDEGRGSEARFSSPEPEPVSRTRKRRIVEDSDEEDEDEQPAPKRSRMNRTVTSDSEDEVPTQSDRRGRASRTIVSDSESDIDEEAKKPATSNSKTKPVVISDSEEGEGSEESESEESEGSEDEESESEDEDKSPPRMSLAERLRMHRRDNPVDDESGPGGSEDDDSAGDSEDDEDESDDDRRGGASMFFDGMAEEEDEEDDYDESLL